MAILLSQFIERLCPLKIKTLDQGTVFVVLEAKIGIGFVKHGFHNPDLVNGR
jgi:hypothetical protein